MSKAYELHFSCKVRDQDKVCTTNICCSSCTWTLAGKGIKKAKGILLFKAKISKNK